MPRNVFGTAPLADKVRPGIENLLNEGAVRGVRGLSKLDRRVLRQGAPMLYIYNVSPVWEWVRAVAGRGTVLIPKRKSDERVSKALEVPGILVRDFDRGGGVREKYIEEGEDLAQDILCCSTDMPGMAANNLLNYGCFYLVGRPFEELAVADQHKHLDEATAKHDIRCREKVLEADQLWANPRSKNWITEVYRLCALYLHEKREWAGHRGQQTPVQECAWCGYEAKRGIAICPNCKNVLNQEAYDQLTKAMPSPKAESPRSRKPPES